MWAYLTIFRLAFSFFFLFLTLEEQGQQKLHHSECGNEWHDDRQETTDRRAQQIASLFTRDFFFFTPPSLPRPRRECRRGMKKKKNPQWGGHARAATHKTQASRVSGDPLFSTGFSSSGVHGQTGRMCTGIKLLLRDNIQDKDTEPRCETLCEKVQKEFQPAVKSE